ncbi:MAG: BMP family ABC transporter substrate-binding protein [Anaerolineales bacterium]|nr:BMP family ABC transporter substrate-binding protein [Anaerolineales bacterium]
MKRLPVVLLISCMVFITACQQATPAPTATNAPALVEQEPTQAPQAEEPAEAEEAPQAITLVTGTGGLGDLTFNDQGWAGTQRAAEDFGLEASVTEPKSMADITSIHLENAKSGKFLVSIGLGAEQQDAISTAAAEYPEQKFIYVDEAVDAPNVASYIFRHREPAFLLGVAGAILTQQTDIENMNPEKIIGIIVGVDYPTIHESYTGFVAGAKWVDPEMEVLFGEVGAWNDPSKGNEIALSQYGQGADIIWHTAGGSSLGLFDAAKALDLYVMGCDVDQSPMDPDHVVCSWLKRLDETIYRAVESAVDGTFEGGIHSVGLKEGGHDYTCRGETNVPIPDEVFEKADEAKAKIISGEIVVPATDEELAAFLESLGISD